MTHPLTIALADKRPVTFDLPDEGTGPPVFALSVRKSGSSVFNQMVTALGAANGYGFIDIGGTLLSQNVLRKQWQHDRAMGEILRPGIIYGGFREMPFALTGRPLFDSSPKILMVRDPRDVVVSDYFSTAYSHPIPEPSRGRDDARQLLLRKRSQALNTSIDEWAVREIEGILRTMAEYSEILDSSTSLVVRYEDYIFEKPALLRTIAAHVGWRADEAVIGQILQWADVRPSQENPREFVRQVVPGDHRAKLTSNTILALTNRSAATLRMFGYAEASFE